MYDATFESREGRPMTTTTACGCFWTGTETDSSECDRHAWADEARLHATSDEEVTA